METRKLGGTTLRSIGDISRHQRLTDRLSLREVAIREELREANGCECLLLCRVKA